MVEIDKLYLKYPFYGSRKMTKALNFRGYKVNRKRIKQFYQLMGIQAIGPKPNTSCLCRAIKSIHICLGT